MGGFRDFRGACDGGFDKPCGSCFEEHDRQDPTLRRGLRPNVEKSAPKHARAPELAPLHQYVTDVKS